MEEFVDILNEITGEVTGETISKKEAHKTGVWHGSVHIWIISEDKKRILLQRRCPDKNLFPNMWDISVGGHVSSGEEPLISAKRELSEEDIKDMESIEGEKLKIINLILIITQ